MKISVDSHLLQSIQDLIVKASKQNGSKSKSNYNHTARKQRSGNTKSTQRSLLSTMSPAHPTAIMANNPINLFDETGVFQGTINKSITYKMSFHKWGVDAPVLQLLLLLLDAVQTQVEQNQKFCVSGNF